MTQANKRQTKYPHQWEIAIASCTLHSMHNKASKLSHHFYLLMEKKRLCCYFHVWHPNYRRDVNPFYKLDIKDFKLPSYESP